MRTRCTKGIDVQVIVEGEEMVTVNLPRNIVFYSVLVAFVLMLLRSIQVFVARP